MLLRMLCHSGRHGTLASRGSRPLLVRTILTIRQARQQDDEEKGEERFLHAAEGPATALPGPGRSGPRKARPRHYMPTKQVSIFIMVDKLHMKRAQARPSDLLSVSRCADYQLKGGYAVLLGYSKLWIQGTSGTPTVIASLQDLCGLAGSLLTYSLPQ